MLVASEPHIRLTCRCNAQGKPRWHRPSQLGHSHDTAVKHWRRAEGGKGGGGWGPQTRIDRIPAWYNGNQNQQARQTVLFRLLALFEVQLSQKAECLANVWLIPARHASLARAQSSPAPSSRESGRRETQAPEASVSPEDDPDGLRFQVSLLKATWH